MSCASSPYPTMRPLPYCREAGEFSFTTCQFDLKLLFSFYIFYFSNSLLPQGSLCRSSEHRVPHFFLVAPSFSCLSLPRTSWKNETGDWSEQKTGILGSRSLLLQDEVFFPSASLLLLLILACCGCCFYKKNNSKIKKKFSDAVGPGKVCIFLSKIGSSED